MMTVKDDDIRKIFSLFCCLASEGRCEMFLARMIENKKKIMRDLDLISNE